METEERSCSRCGESEGSLYLEPCSVCLKLVCRDCSNRAYGRKFCSAACGRAYFFQGEDDHIDDPDAGSEE